MKDLKENIQKNNMKNLVLSAVLGVFCYCTNNAAKNPIDINKVLTIMLKGQLSILIAKDEMKKYEAKIYSKIKEENGKVTKYKLYSFIKTQFPEDEEQLIEDSNMKRIEKYFHLEKLINWEDECNEGNLTEIFWSKEGEGGEIGEEAWKKIKNYFQAIIKAENELSKAFEEYYKFKKKEAEKKEAEKKEDEILEIKKKEQAKEKEDEILEVIIKECCGEGTEGEMDQKFSANLVKKLETVETDQKTIKETLLHIKRRITLDATITKKNLKSFLKQKIGLQDEKDTKPGEEEGCSCCNDCCENE